MFVHCSCFGFAKNVSVICNREMNMTASNKWRDKEKEWTVSVHGRRNQLILLLKGNIYFLSMSGFMFYRMT